MNTITHNLSLFAKKWYIGETTLFLALTLLIPSLVHLIPTNDGISMGARLLPIFYAPFVATILFRYPVGLVIALIAPSVNYLLFGKPALPIVAVLSLELVLFVSIVALLNKIKQVRYVLAALGYVLAKFISSSLVLLFPQIVEMKAKSFLLQSLSNAWLGLLVLVILSTLIAKFKKNS